MCVMRLNKLNYAPILKHERILFFWTLGYTEVMKRIIMVTGFISLFQRFGIGFATNSIIDERIEWLIQQIIPGIPILMKLNGFFRPKSNIRLWTTINEWAITFIFMDNLDKSSSGLTAFVDQL